MEQRTREKASRAVSDILKAAGFDVHHATAPLDMSAIRKNTYLLVMCTDDPEEAYSYSDTEYTIRVGQEEKVCEKLLVTFNPSITADNCLVWYPEEFALYAGEAVLARVLNKTLVLPLDGMEESSSYKARGSHEPDTSVRIPHLPVRVHRDELKKRPEYLESQPFVFFHTGCSDIVAGAVQCIKTRISILMEMVREL